MKILLSVRMQPVAIALNYNVENIMERHMTDNNVIYEKSRFNSLAWGSLMLPPITFKDHKQEYQLGGSSKPKVIVTLRGRGVDFVIL